MASYLVFTVTDGKHRLEGASIRVYCQGSPTVEQVTDAKGKAIFKLPSKHETNARYFAQWRDRFTSAKTQTMERVVDGSININFTDVPPQFRGDCCI